MGGCKLCRKKRYVTLKWPLTEYFTHCRLTEIGPRLSLQLVKIQEGMCDGDILYHEFIVKTESEMAAIQEIRRRKQ